MVGREGIKDKEDKPMNKPLKDWTLGEMQELCKKVKDDCIGCPALDSELGCVFQIGALPEWWVLD